MTTEELEASLQVSTKGHIKAIGPGSRLRKIREAKHISIQEIAKHTRLNSERLIQLENDDYRLMGAPAFAKGYLRAYASQLGVAKEEVTDILQAFDELNLGESVERNTPELIHEKIDPVNPKSVRWVSYLLVILVLGLFGYLYHQHFNGLNKTANNEAATQSADTSLIPNNTTPGTTTSAAPIESPPVLQQATIQQPTTGVLTPPPAVQPTKER